MKKNYLFLIALLISLIGFSQTATVSTFMDSPDADIDDALALDSQGNLYGSNFAGTSVYKITPTGEVSTFATGFSNPNGLAFDSMDNLYIADYTGSAIYKYDINGNLLQSFPIDGFPSGMISAYKSDSVIFTIVDFGPSPQSINELAPDGTITELYSGAPLNVPVGLAYGPGGDLYIGNYLGREIYRLPAGGTELEYVATVPAPDNFVPFLAFITYAQGYLYGTVYGENKIYKINPNKIDDVVIYSGSTFGFQDGDISEATYAFPAGILANKSGNTLYVSDFSGQGNIRKIVRGKGKANNIKSSVKLYPNPSGDVVNVNAKLSKKGAYTITIYDLSGQVLHKESGLARDTNFSKRVNLPGLKHGLYRIVIDNNGEQTVRSLAVE